MRKAEMELLYSASSAQHKDASPSRLHLLYGEQYQERGTFEKQVEDFLADHLYKCPTHSASAHQWWPDYPLYVDPTGVGIEASPTFERWHERWLHMNTNYAASLPFHSLWQFTDQKAHLINNKTIRDSST